MKHRQTLVSPDRAGWPQFAADWIAKHLAAIVAERGAAHLALAGGGTPSAVYERLAAAPHGDEIPWPAVSVYFGDERCVAADDPQSNFRMARETLLDRVPLPTTQVFRMAGELHDRAAAAAEYDACLPQRLDLLLLGVGNDGHTASLFPRSELLRETQRRVAAVQGDKPPPWRLSITPPVIAAARQVVVLAQGSGKAAIVAQALHDPFDPERLPIQLAQTALWILDPDAAALLRNDELTKVES